MQTGVEAGAESDYDLAIDSEGLRSAAARGSFIIAAAQLIKTVMMFASQILLARLLLPEDFGLIAMVAPVIGFALILNNMGLGEALVQRDKIDQDRISSLFWGSLAMSLLLAGTMSALTPVIAHFYSNQEVVPLLIFSSLTIPLSTLGAVPAAILTRKMRFFVLQCNDIVSTFFGIIATVTLALYGARYWSLPLGAIIGTLLSLTTMWIAARWRPIWPERWSTAKDDLLFGGNLALSNIATYFTTTADNIIIGSVNGATALGYYDRSYRLVVQPIAQLISPIAGVAVPLLSRLRSESTDFRQSYLRFVRAALILTLPPSIICITFGDRIIPLLLGNNWTLAAPTFSWIALGGTTSALYSSLTWLFVSQDQTSRMRKATFISAIINVSSFALGARWGVEGVAALGAITFVFITTPLTIRFATIIGNVSTLDIVRLIWPYYSGALISVLALTYAKAYMPNDPFLWIPSSGTMLLVLTFLPALLMPRERAEFIAAISLVSRRVKLAFARFGRGQ